MINVFSGFSVKVGFFHKFSKLKIAERKRIIASKRHSFRSYGLDEQFKHVLVMHHSINPESSQVIPRGNRIVDCYEVRSTVKAVGDATQCRQKCASSVCKINPQPR